MGETHHGWVGLASGAVPSCMAQGRVRVRSLHMLSSLLKLSRIIPRSALGCGVIVDKHSCLRLDEAGEGEVKG